MAAQNGSDLPLKPLFTGCDTQIAGLLFSYLLELSGWLDFMSYRSGRLMDLSGHSIAVSLQGIRGQVLHQLG